MKSSVSIIIPAYNEEQNLAATLQEVVTAAKGALQDYEIIIVNDASADATGMIADNLAREYGHVRVVHNKKNGGLGYSYKQGLANATKQYVTFFPGDNSFPTSSITKLFGEIGKADIIIPYHTNLHIRPLSRQIISRLFTSLVNFMFGLHLRYYNGTVVHKTALIRSLPLATNSFAFQVEALVTLIKKGASYREIGIQIQEKKQGSSKAFKAKNVFGVLKALIVLFWNVRVKG